MNGQRLEGRVWIFSILLELILCLAWLDSGEPNLPGSSRNELTAAHLFLVEVITAEPFLAAAKHTILGSSFWGGVHFLKGHEKLLILIFCINRVWVRRPWATPLTGELQNVLFMTKCRISSGSTVHRVSPPAVGKLSLNLSNFTLVFRRPSEKVCCNERRSKK